MPARSITCESNLTIAVAPRNRSADCRTGVRQAPARVGRTLATQGLHAIRGQLRKRRRPLTCPPEADAVRDTSPLLAFEAEEDAWRGTASGTRKSRSSRS